MEKTINKIMMVSFVLAACFLGYTVHVLNTLLSSSWTLYARLVDSEVISNLLPVIFGVLFFGYLNFSKSIKVWANEVIVEISKVVWPSQKDTTAMTIFVCFFMILSGVLLGIFDLVSGKIIRMIIGA